MLCRPHLVRKGQEQENVKKTKRGKIYNDAQTSIGITVVAVITVNNDKISVKKPQCLTFC